jgi:hypothetical protein
MNEHTSGSDLLRELNQRFADDPIYGAKLLLFDRDPMRVTQAVVDAMAAAGIQVLLLTPNVHGNSSIDGSLSWLRPVLTKAAFELGGWAALKPVLSEKLLEIEAAVENTPYRELGWRTPDEFIALAEDVQRDNLLARHYKTMMKAAERVENQKKKPPQFIDGWYLYWSPQAALKHPDYHHWEPAPVHHLQSSPKLYV